MIYLRSIAGSVGRAGGTLGRRETGLRREENQSESFRSIRLDNLAFYVHRAER